MDQPYLRERLAKWAEILGRPRKFLRGDALPAEMCDALSGEKALVLATLVGLILPSPVIGQVLCTGIGMAMLNDSVKRQALRWAADNLRSRHILVRDEAEDALIRFETNTVGTQWLPLASFRLSQGEIELGVSEQPDAAVLAGTLERGSRVVIVGLISGRELNGQAANVVSWDEETGRYKVETGSAGARRIKPRNMRRAGTADAPSVVPRECIRFAQELGAPVVGPSSGVPEDMMRSKTLDASEQIVKGVFKALDPNVWEDDDSRLVVEHTFWLEDRPDVLHHHIAILRDGRAVSASYRQESMELHHDESAAPLDDAHDDAPCRPHSPVPAFSNGPVGGGFRAGGQYSVVGTAAMREGEALSTALTGQLSAGDAVVIVDIVGRRAKVRSSTGTGWISVVSSSGKPLLGEKDGSVDAI